MKRVALAIFVVGLIIFPGCGGEDSSIEVRESHFTQQTTETTKTETTKTTSSGSGSSTSSDGSPIESKNFFYRIKGELELKTIDAGDSLVHLIVGEGDGSLDELELRSDLNTLNHPFEFVSPKLPVDCNVTGQILLSQKLIVQLESTTPKIGGAECFGALITIKNEGFKIRMKNVPARNGGGVLVKDLIIEIKH